MEVKNFSPNCKQDYTINEYREGAQVECVKCQHVFRLSKEVVQKTPPIFKAQVAFDCPVCGGKVSPAAYACPHCGQPLKKRKKCRSLKGGLICLAIAFVQFYLVNAICDKIWGKNAEAGLPLSILLFIGLVVAACICLTAPNTEA